MYQDVQTNGQYYFLWAVYKCRGLIKRQFEITSLNVLALRWSCYCIVLNRTAQSLISSCWFAWSHKPLTVKSFRGSLNPWSGFDLNPRNDPSFRRIKYLFLQFFICSPEIEIQSYVSIKDQLKCPNMTTWTYHFAWKFILYLHIALYT